MGAVGAAAVDNVIHEVRFAEAYRHWSSSEHEKSLIVNQGDLVLIRMNENPGTGYRWIIVDEDIPSEICTLQLTVMMVSTRRQPRRMALTIRSWMASLSNMCPLGLGSGRIHTHGVIAGSTCGARAPAP